MQRLIWLVSPTLPCEQHPAHLSAASTSTFSFSSSSSSLMPWSLLLCEQHPTHLSAELTPALENIIALLFILILASVLNAFIIVARWTHSRIPFFPGASLLQFIAPLLFLFNIFIPVSMWITSRPPIFSQHHCCSAVHLSSSSSSLMLSSLLLCVQHPEYMFPGSTIIAAHYIFSLPHPSSCFISLSLILSSLFPCEQHPTSRIPIFSQQCITFSSSSSSLLISLSFILSSLFLWTIFFLVSILQIN